MAPYKFSLPFEGNCLIAFAATSVSPVNSCTNFGWFPAAKIASSSLKLNLRTSSRAPFFTAPLSHVVEPEESITMATLAEVVLDEGAACAGDETGTADTTMAVTATVRTEDKLNWCRIVECDRLDSAKAGRDRLRNQINLSVRWITNGGRRTLINEPLGRIRHDFRQ